MGLEDVQVSIEIEVANPQAHARLLLAVLVHRDSANQGVLGERAVPIVLEVEAWRGIAGNIDVGPTVVVKVRGNGRHPVRPASRFNPSLGAYVGEMALTVVAIQVAASRRQAARAAVHGHVLVEAEVFLARLRRRGGIEVQVVRDEKIEMTVPVVVDPRAARTPSALRDKQTGFLGHVLECAPAVVAIEHVLAPIRDEQVVEPVVVVIAHRDGRCPPCAPQARLLRHFFERSIPIVLVQADSRLLGAVFEARTGEQQHVQPSVVVVVEERAAAADRFENEGRRVRRTVDHRLRQAGLGGHIRQARPEGDPGWLAAPLRPHVADSRPLLRRQGRGGEAKPLTAGPPHRHSRRERLGYHGRQIGHGRLGRRYRGQHPPSAGYLQPGGFQPGDLRRHCISPDALRSAPVPCPQRANVST